MEDLKNIHCETLDPSTGLRISLVLLRDVKNCVTLKEKVVSGVLQCCLIKPVLIADPFQVVVAANKAAISFLSKSMVTKSVYTELLFNLSISKNISQSLTKFGVEESDSDVLVATIHSADNDCMHEVIALADGNVAPIVDLQNIYNVKIICKLYKISDLETRAVSLLDSIVSRIATCGFVSL